MWKKFIKIGTWLALSMFLASIILDSLEYGGIGSIIIVTVVSFLVVAYLLRKFLFK